MLVLVLDHTLLPYLEVYKTLFNLYCTVSNGALINISKRFLTLLL